MNYATSPPSPSYVNYATHVDDLRKKFSIRIQIDDRMGRMNLTNEILESYLQERLGNRGWAIQNNIYAGLYFVWFSNNEDALACMLTWNGKEV